MDVNIEPRWTGTAVVVAVVSVVRRGKLERVWAGQNTSTHTVSAIHNVVSTTVVIEHGREVVSDHHTEPLHLPDFSAGAVAGCLHSGQKSCYSEWVSGTLRRVVNTVSILS